MTLTRAHLALLAIAGSAGLLLCALAFQHLGGLYPCILCLWQRWPHLVALLIGLAALRWQGPVLPVLAGLAVLTSAAIGSYHFGVEQHWWDGLQQCAVNTLADVSATDLLNTDITVGAPAACDKIAWSFLGLSMAGWNVVASTLIAGLWALAARKS